MKDDLMISFMRVLKKRYNLTTDEALSMIWSNPMYSAWILICAVVVLEIVDETWRLD